MTVQERLPNPDQNIAALEHAPETQQPPEGFSYQCFDREHGFPLYVMTVQHEGRTTYLLPTTEDIERDEEKLRLIANTGAHVRMLPAEADTYSEDEKRRYQDLSARGVHLEKPLVHEHNVEVLLFDPHSVKSLLDVMIATGHDTPELRAERRAALRGEETPTITILKSLEQMTRSDDPRATALSDVLGFSDGLYSDTLIEQLVSEGSDSSSVDRVRSKLESGINPELVESTVAEPERLQAIITQAWNEIIIVAREHNKDVHRNRLYVELHQVGGVLIPVPAVVSTDMWESAKNMLGDIDVTGAGHTLTEMYSHDSVYGKSYSYALIKYHESQLARLSKEIGLGVSGRATLQRRCLTTFDELGDPVIHLQESDNYRFHPKKARDEWIFSVLDKQGIKSDLQLADKRTVDIVAETARLPVENVFTEIDILDLPEESRSTTPTATLLRARNSSKGVYLSWAYGYAKRHEDLWNAVHYDEPQQTNPYVNVRLGDTDFSLQAKYVVIEEPVSGETTQVLTWIFRGGRDDIGTFEQFMPKLQSTIVAAERAMGKKMNRLFGANPDAIQSGLGLLVLSEENKPIHSIEYNVNTGKTISHWRPRK